MNKNRQPYLQHRPKNASSEQKQTATCTTQATNVSCEQKQTATYTTPTTQDTNVSCEQKKTATCTTSTTHATNKQVKKQPKSLPSSSTQQKCKEKHPLCKNSLIQCIIIMCMPEKIDLICTICDEKFKTLKQKLNHDRSCSKYYECDICMKPFQRKDMMEKHRK